MLLEIGIAFALWASKASAIESATSFTSQQAPARQISDAELAARRAVYGPGFEHVEAEGWTFLSSNNNTVTFVQLPHQPRIIWSRVESKTRRDGVRSKRVLNEVDCAGRRIRPVTVETYFEANLDGLVETLNDASDWISPAANTMGERILNAACRP